MIKQCTLRFDENGEKNKTNPFIYRVINLTYNTYYLTKNLTFFKHFFNNIFKYIVCS